MKRLAVLIVALLIGAAAPARAWCEATCLAPAAHSRSTTPHCPSHDQPSDSPSMSAATDADCPAIESARPVQAKLDFAPATLAVSTHFAAPQHPGTIGPRHTGTEAPRHLRSLPLRI